ncbi:probable arginine N-methyltransferase 3 [Olea europaea subsp. europaea]|uniref:Probable arginine N-methyltransferase 3 n=1 Tax=Olea europaea subsp. europaea TaxID=158383 RepID=A0A8S0VI92_OLEEU|nr:probable arginine N-methyltransferase 3 [Olea europaea subsp. europaea]
MLCIGLEEVEYAARNPIIDVIDSCDIITTTQVRETFDPETMRSDQMDFLAKVELKPKLVTPTNDFTGSKPEITEGFCSDMPTSLSTSPYNPKTHWSQNILTFQEPIALASMKVNQSLLVRTLVLL